MNALTPISKIYSDADSYVTTILDGAKENSSKDAKTATKFITKSPIELANEAARIKKIMTDLDCAMRAAVNDLIDIRGYVSADVATTLLNYQSSVLQDMAHDVGPILVPLPN